MCFASSKFYKSKHSNISRIVLQYWLLDSIQFSSAIVELEKGKKERSKKCRSTWSGVKYHSAQLLLLKESMCECVLLIYICLKSVYFGISVIYKTDEEISNEYAGRCVFEIICQLIGCWLIWKMKKVSFHLIWSGISTSTVAIKGECVWMIYVF